MYTECLKCPKLGVSCDGPNFLDMNAHDLMEWCRARKESMNLSNAKLAELSGVPKGTIDRMFRGESFDFKYETIRPIVKALIGGEWQESKCPQDATETNENMLETLRRLENENTKYREYIMDSGQQHREDLEARKTEDQNKVDFLKNQLKWRRAVIIILAVLLFVCMAVIIGALAIDRMNGDLGYFWRAASGFSRSGAAISGLEI